MNNLLIILIMFFFNQEISDTTYKTESLEWMKTNLSIEVEGAICPNDCNKGYFYNLEEARRAVAKLNDGWRIPTHNDWIEFEKSLNQKGVGSAYSKGALKLYKKTDFIIDFNGLLNEKNEILEANESIYFLANNSSADNQHYLVRKFSKGEDEIYKSLLSNQFRVNVRLVRDL